jgi:hypothetical protein
MWKLPNGAVITAPRDVEVTSTETVPRYVTKMVPTEVKDESGEVVVKDVPVEVLEDREETITKTIPKAALRRWPTAALIALGIIPMSEEQYDKRRYRSVQSGENVQPDGTIVIKHMLEEIKTAQEILVERKKDLVKELKRDLHAYLDDRGYDGGTQRSLIAFYSDPDKPVAKKAKAKQVWAWIESVMGYYYQCKDAIVAMDGAALNQIGEENPAWDFSVMDATDPKLQLKAMYVGD